MLTKDYCDVMAAVCALQACLCRAIAHEEDEHGTRYDKFGHEHEGSVALRLMREQVDRLFRFADDLKGNR